MTQLIEDLISAIEYHVEQTRPIHSTTIALQAARDALKSLPPQRAWVDLSDEEIETLIHRFDGDPHTLLDEVNARLKEKNT